MTAQQRKDLSLFSAQELQEVEKLVKVMPVIDVSARAYTEGETEMTASDAVTLEFKIKLPLLNEKQYPGYAHSRNYPYLKKQGFWVIISDVQKERTILAHKMVLRAPKQASEMRVLTQEEIEKEPLNEE